MSYTQLPESTSNLYAELLEQALQVEAQRTATSLPGGTFVRKQIRGRIYWYLQRREGEKKRQHYLGPESAALLDWMQEVNENRAAAAEEHEDSRRLCAMLRAGGAFVESATVARVLELLAEARIFHLGGVLIGTHAFAVYGNLLGVRLESPLLRTQDIDVAQDPTIGVALLADAPASDVEESFRASELKVHPVPGLDPRHPATSFNIRGRELRVDFLTPLFGAEKEGPVFLPALKISAQPLRFLDFLIEHPVQAVVVGKQGILVNVPQPARFALHKLWTSQSRPAVWQIRARKDLAQAACLIEVLLDDRPGDLLLAWDALDRHPRARKKMLRAAESLPPKAGERFSDLVRE